MAGMMYLGNQKVTPVIVQGDSGGYTEFPSYQVVNGIASKRGGTLTGNEFKDITSISSYGFYYLYYDCSDLTGALDLSSLVSVGNYGLYYSFYNSSITGVDLSSLETVGSYGLNRAFYNDTDLSGADLSSLRTIGSYGLQDSFVFAGLSSFLNLESLVSVGRNGLYNAFPYTKITGVDLSSLTTIGINGLYGAFHDCEELAGVVRFSSLNELGRSGLSSAFENCQNLTDLYFNSLRSTSFGSYDNQFFGMLFDVEDCIVHFPSNLESVIGEWDDVLSGFDGINTTVLFDLEATS